MTDDPERTATPAHHGTSPLSRSQTHAPATEELRCLPVEVREFKWSTEKTNATA